MGTLQIIKHHIDGYIHFLDSSPVSCGTSLDLLMPGNQWQRVRFELTGQPQVPVFYLTLGHPCEVRFVVSEGEGPLRWRLYDRLYDRLATRDFRDEEGYPTYADSLEVDRWSHQGEAQRVADVLNRELAPNPSARMFLPDNAELRWPR